MKDANLAVTLALNQYRAGTVAYTAVVTAQAIALNDAQTLLNIRQSRLVASVTLIQALGGGWSTQRPVRGARRTAHAAVRRDASGARVQVLVDAARERGADAAHLREIGDPGAHDALQAAEMLQQRASLRRPEPGTASSTDSL